MTPEDEDGLFTEDWYARQFAGAVERKETWAVVLMEELDKQMKHYLNTPPLLMDRRDDDTV